jgi:multidrug efflux pump subunit AcrA (membrane-fusion protein)
VQRIGELQQKTDQVSEKRSLKGRAGLILRGSFQLVVAIALIVAAIAGARYLVATKTQLGQQAATEPIYTVEAATASLQLIRPSFEVFGVIEARSSVEMRALVAGEVVDVNPNVAVGGRIAKGERLIQIDPFSYQGAVTEAEANLAEAKAQIVENEARLENERSALKRVGEQLDLARRDLERAENLAERGSGTPQSVDDRRLTVSQRQQLQEAAANAIVARQAQIDQLKASLQRLEWRLKQARRDLQDTELKAPFDAIIRSEAVEIGRRLGVNDVVAELYEADALDVRFTVSDRQFGRLQSEAEGVLGRNATVSWAVGDQPITATATVDRIGSDVSATRGGVELIGRIDMSGGDAERLKPGAVVTVSMPDKAYPNAARLPETALFNGAYVFTIQTDAEGADRLQRRPVTALAWDGTHVIIQAKDPGWLNGARVMTTRLAEAGDGVRVRVPKAKPAPVAASEAALRDAGEALAGKGAERP